MDTCGVRKLAKKRATRIKDHKINRIDVLLPWNYVAGECAGRLPFSNNNWRSIEAMRKQTGEHCEILEVLLKTDPPRRGESAVTVVTNEEAVSDQI